VAIRREIPENEGDMPRDKNASAHDVAVGERIKQARKRRLNDKGKPMKQADLARLLGVESPTMWRYEHGQLPCPLDRLVQISDVLEVSVDWLLGRRRARKASAQPTDLVRLATLGLQAAQDGSADALDRFNEMVLDYARSIDDD
jgi:transcriptional regulator with XRE-family HTH domain